MQNFRSVAQKGLSYSNWYERGHPYKSNSMAMDSSSNFTVQLNPAK